MTSENGKQNTQSEKTTDLYESILSRIEKEHVAPVPRWRFVLVEYGIWTLWGLSVLFGAIAFSVLLFYFTHAGFAVYEATHDTVLGLLIDATPLAWLVVFALMASLAHYNLRHTKRGYRFTVLRVLLSSILFSFFGGIMFHVLGMGFLVDTFISSNVPLLPSVEQLETRIWQHPKQGRLLGTYDTESAKEGVVEFVDVNGMSWHLDTAELNELDLKDLYTGKKVRIMGLASTTNTSHFYGCAVLPFIGKGQSTISSLFEERSRFLERMRDHAKTLNELFATSSEPQLVKDPVCKEYKAVLRVGSL